MQWFMSHLRRALTRPPILTMFTVILKITGVNDPPPWLMPFGPIEAGYRP
jgi:hypothetical protein